jgi:hypothetical protein
MRHFPRINLPRTLPTIDCSQYGYKYPEEPRAGFSAPSSSADRRPSLATMFILDELARGVRALGLEASNDWETDLGSVLKNCR